MQQKQKKIRDKILSNLKSDFRAMKLYAKSLNLFKNIFDKWSDYLINQIIIFLVKFCRFCNLVLVTRGIL